MKKTWKMLLAKKKKILFFSFVFVVAKSLVFLAPLFLSNELSLEEYSLFEYAITFGGIFAVILGTGFEGAYPYFTLKQNRNDIDIVFFWKGIAVFVLLLLNVVIFYFFDYGSQYYLGVNIACVFFLQRMFSSILKTHEKSSMAVILDGGIYVLLIVALYFLKVVYQEVSFDYLMLFIYLYAFFLFVIFTRQLFISIHILPKKIDIIKINRYGIQLVGVSFLLMFLTGSGRILAERFLGLDDVGIYGFYFRIAAAIVLFHQFVNIIFFKKIYVTNPKVLDIYFSIFLVFCLILTVLNYLIFPELGKTYLSLLSNYDIYSKIFLQLCLFSPLWIAVALLENIVYRENLAKYLNKGLFIICGLYVLMVLILYLLEILNLSVLILTHTVTMCSVALFQIYILKKRSISFTKMFAIISIILIINIITFLFY